MKSGQYYICLKDVLDVDQEGSSVAYIKGEVIFFADPPPREYWRPLARGKKSDKSKKIKYGIPGNYKW